MRILLCPDSYKGCLSSVEVCNAMAEGLNKANNKIEIMQYPSSDGGEGFCDCMGNLFGGKKVEMEVTYPMGNKGNAFYIFNDSTRVAYIELALAAGLNLVPSLKRNVMRATSYGVGEMICDAVENGAEEIYIGLGGSATNDCGIGMLAAMGAIFVDENGYFVPPYAENLGRISYADTSNMVDVSHVRIYAACDVTNPLCGENGAAKVFAKQKGASDIEIALLDEYAGLFCKKLDIDSQRSGFGAAGGTGMALISFLNAKYISGASLLVNSTEFKNALSKADLVITGEGNTDSQTAEGKLVSVVAKTAKNMGVPVIVISGGLTDGFEKLYPLGVKKCFALTEENSDVDFCMAHGYELIKDKIYKVINNEKIAF